MRRIIGIVTWALFATALVLPVLLAAASPLLAWRDPVYIAAGFAGIVALALLLVQPVLAVGLLPGLPTGTGRRVHRWTGGLLSGAVILHVGGLWITSPPDVIDALLFVSPTPFAVWGVVAMWALCATATLAALRKRLHLRLWRAGHTGLGVVIVTGSVVHAVLIEGTMETASKIGLCALVLAAMGRAVILRRAWARRPGRGPERAPERAP